MRRQLPVGATSSGAAGGASAWRRLPPLQRMTGESGDGNASGEYGENGEKGFGAAASAAAAADVVVVVVSFFFCFVFCCCW